MPLRQTATFDLVPRALAPNAVALIQTGWSLMRSLGPAVGGLLILWFGPAGNFFVQASAYALIAVTVLQIHFPPARGPTGASWGCCAICAGASPTSCGSAPPAPSS